MIQSVPAETNDPAARLVLPEGYVSQETKEGSRLAIYETYTGAWLGDLNPLLANAQEVAQDLISAHEEDKERRELLTDLVLEEIEPVEFAEQQDTSATQGHEEWLESLAGDNPQAAALRIRELEIAAALAMDSLRAAGDEASAEVVRAVLESTPDDPLS